MPRAKFQINQLNYQKFKLTAILSFAVLFLSGVYFVHPFDFNSANATTDTASCSYNGTTYSLTTTVSDLNLELNALPTGSATYGKQTVNVVTNAPGGYQLYMQTSGNLTGTKDGNATSDSIAALSSDNVALDMNTWGYVTAASLSSASTTINKDPNTAAEQTIWNTPPTTITQVDSTSSAAASGRDTDIYYGIKADNSLDGENYSGTIAYTTVASDVTSTNESTNGLVVSPTSGTAGAATTLTITTPLMATASLTASDITATVGSYSCTSITITSQAPLTFTCSITVSAAGTYDVTANISKYSKAYTKSSAYTVTTPDLSSITYMQDATSETCKNSRATSSTSDYTTYKLTDRRNSQQYFIRKIGNQCWMVENLYLIGGTVLTYTDSNTSTTLPASSTAYFTYSYESSPQVYNGTKDSGSYYNWSAANKVCPKNWSLPSSGQGDTLANNIAYKTAIFFANSSGAPTSVIEYGTYAGSFAPKGTSLWTSTNNDSTYAYVLKVNSTEAYADGAQIKHAGMPVRCILTS